MTNLTIQASNNHLEFYFNDLSTESGVKEDIWPFPVRVMMTNDERIVLYGRFGASYTLTSDGSNGTYSVYKVGDVIVESTNHLLSLIELALGIQ